VNPIKQSTVPTAYFVPDAAEAGLFVLAGSSDSILQLGKAF